MKNKKTTKITIWTILTIILLAGTTQAALTDGIREYYKLDEITGDIASETGNYTMYQRGTVESKTGIINTARGNYSTAKYFVRNETFNTTNSITISTWVRYNGGSTATSQDLVSMSEGTGGWVRLWYTSAGNFQFFYHIGGASTCNNAIFAKALATNAWYNIVGIHNSTGCYIYLNGTYQAGETKTGSGYIVQNMMFGAEATYPSEGGAGAGATAFTIDETAVWARGLSPTEITSVYNNGAAGISYPFNEFVNVTITGADMWNSTPTPNITATICNGATCYTYTNNTAERVTTIIMSNSTLLWNVTANATGYNSGTNLNVNVSGGNILMYLDPLYSTTGHMFINATNLCSGGTICSLEMYTPYTRNATSCTIDSGIAKNSTTLWNFSLGGGIGFNNLTYNNINVSNNLTATFSETSISYYLTLIGRNWLNTTNLSSVVIWENYTSTTQYTNPFMKIITEYINYTNPYKILNVTMQDGTHYHRNYTGTINASCINRTHYLIPEPNKLMLTFEKNGSSANTTGYITDTDKRMDWSNNSIVIVQENLSEGYVQVAFNNLNSTTNNMTQFYEYYNDYETHISETMELVQNADWSHTIQTIDYTQSPLKDVYIRCYYAYRRTLWTFYDYKLIGQRLTNDEGKTYFWGDKGSTLYCTATKDGYQSGSILILLGDISYEQDTPYKIWLKEDTEATTDLVWINFGKYILKNETNITGGVFAPTKDTIMYSTSYRQGLGLTSLVDITSTKDGLGRYTINLINNTDFLSNNNFTLITCWDTITIDYNYCRNITFNYPTDTTNYRLTLGEDKEALDNKTERIILAIMIILFAAGTSLLFRSTNAGITGFIAGCIIASMWQWIFGAVLLLVLGIYVLIRLVVRKWLED